MKKLLFVVVLSIAAVAAAKPPAAPRKAPKLILQITIDQLRGDLPFRYAARFSPRGFRLFMDHGIWYADAQHQHGEYETVVGHTTLATGAWPSRHGMITNSAFDQYGAGTPAGIPVTTFSDELNITTYGGAKIFAVSMKDRAAVPMAGHTGKAFWYSSSTGCFETNTPYYGALPQWVVDWCAGKPADKYANTDWVQLQNPDTYLFKDFKNVYPKGSVAEENMLTLEKYRFRRTFPHPLGSGPALYQNLMLAPQGDTLTADFAKELIRKEALGRDDITDYLAVSLSLTDYIGHWFSPSSLESEDNLLRLDRTLEALFAFIDAEIGLQNTLLVLSADHGGPEYPEYLETIKIPTGRVTSTAVLDAATAAVAARFQTNAKIISSYSPPYFYLDQAVVQSLGITSASVEATIAEAVMKVEGIAVAVPISQLLNGGGQADPDFLLHLRRNYFPGRSGQVHVVPKPQWQLDSASPGSTQLLQHPIPWAYDGYVPVAFAGAGLPSAMVYRRISTTDVAATLSAYVKTKFPSGNVGVPLPEVVNGPR